MSSVIVRHIEVYRSCDRNILVRLTSKHKVCRFVHFCGSYNFEGSKHRDYVNDNACFKVYGSYSVTSISMF